VIKRTGLGLIHIYYGQGVGKTTRAVGLAIRAAGTGLKVNFIQFMKPGASGEILILTKIPNIRYQCPGKHSFIFSRGPEYIHHKHAAEALLYATEASEDGVELLICDEIMDTLIFGLLEKGQILELMEKYRGKVELVMTGASAPEDLIDRADYVTEFKQIKHPYYSGAKARRGIEF
jgi:cob(I)alamin adenosyltransferase